MTHKDKIDRAQILRDIIEDRRAIFPSQYTGERVKDSVINQILECANWAPTHRQTEPWRFEIFTGKSLDSLGEYMADYYKQNTRPEKFSSLKYKKNKTKAQRSSHVLAICMQRDPDESVPEWEEMAAVSCAVQNMWLMCCALGLGAYWSTSASALHAQEFLKLPEGVSCLGWFYVGVPQSTLVLEGKRSSIAKKIRWHH